MRASRPSEAVPTPKGAAVGAALRQWREHRRYSQLGLALDAGISTRHLSSVENGRAQPSRDMLLRLCEFLEVPPRERNTMMLTAGYPPLCSARPLEDPGLADVRQAVRLMLSNFEPCPALAIDRHWTLVDSNRPAQMLMSGVSPALLSGAVNVLRVSLHPNGLAKKIVNLTAWRSIVLRRLAREVDVTKDPVLVDLLQELTSYGAPPKTDGARSGESVATEAEAEAALPILVPMQLSTPLGEMSFWSTTTVFGSAVDATVSELAIESFLPADASTRRALKTLSGS